MKEKKEPLKAVEKISDSLSLPQDVLLSSTILTIEGTSKVFIENYKGITLYHENKIVIQAKHYQVILKGKNLRIEYFNQDDMKICGKIFSIEFVS